MNKSVSVKCNKRWTEPGLSQWKKELSKNTLQEHHNWGDPACLVM